MLHKLRAQELRIQCASAVGRLLQPPALDRGTEHSGLLSWLWLLCLPQNEKGGAFVKDSDSLEEWSKGRGYLSGTQMAPEGSEIRLLCPHLRGPRGRVEEGRTRRSSSQQDTIAWLGIGKGSLRASASRKREQSLQQ